MSNIRHDITKDTANVQGNFVFIMNCIMCMKIILTAAHKFIYLVIVVNYFYSLQISSHNSNISARIF